MIARPLRLHLAILSLLTVVAGCGGSQGTTGRNTSETETPTARNGVRDYQPSSAHENEKRAIPTAKQSTEELAAIPGNTAIETAKESSASMSKPTYPHMPPASEPDPIIAGITILSSSDRVAFDRWEFTINRGEEEEAINALLDSLTEISEFSLSDHSRGDCDSCATYRKVGEKYKMKAGGHGWSSDSTALDRESTVAEMRKQVKYNYGPEWHDCGSLVNWKIKPLGDP